MGDKLKKVTLLDHPVVEETRRAWGVTFLKSGEGDKACYVAEVDSDTAKSLIDAKRAK